MAFTKVHSRHMRLRRGARTVILFHVVKGPGVPSMFEILLVICMRAKVRRGALFPWLVSVDFLFFVLPVKRRESTKSRQIAQRNVIADAEM